MLTTVRKKIGRKAGLPLLMLILVLIYAFLVRAHVYFLPAFSEEEKHYLQDEEGEPYLIEMDSFFFFRKAAEMKEAGEVSIYNYRSEDSLIGQRVYEVRDEGGTPLGLSATAYLLWRFFFSFFGVTLTQVAIWMGPVFGSLAAIPAFFYVRRRTGMIGGVVAGILVGCAVPFVIHTHAGFFDTDMVLAVLPLLFLLGQMRSMQEESIRKQIGFALLSAAAISVMSYFWVAFNAYFLLAVICTALTSLIILLVPSKTFPQPSRRRRWLVIRGGLVSLLTSALLLFITGGIRALRQLLAVLELFRSATGTGSAAMPDAYVFTSEMRMLRKTYGSSLRSMISANTRSILGMLGGAIPCVLAALMIPFTFIVLWRKLRDQDEEVSREGREEIPLFIVDAGFLLPWLLLSLKLAFTSVRYAEISVIPVSLLCGLTVGRIVRVMENRTEKRKMLMTSAAVLLAVVTVFPVCYGSWKAAGSGKSLVTDSKAQAMAYIRENLPENTAVAGWWDDGYYTEYSTRRRTLADGGSSSGRLNWLIGKALMTDDPRLSEGIFRMVNESGTEALDFLLKEGMEGAKAADLLIRILACDREGAAELLREAGVDLSILEKTHPEESNGIVLTLSTDLFAKLGAICYYGFWDPGHEAVGAFTDIRFSSESVSLNESGEADLGMLQSGVVLHITEDSPGHITALYRDAQGGVYNLGRICVWQNGIKIQDEQTVPETRSPSLVLVKEGERYCGIICTKNLCDSMLIRLLFCEDNNVEGMRLIDTWYGDTEKEPCAAQSRINYMSQTTWATQVWQIR